MNDRVARNRRHLADLFAGPFPGHAIIMLPPDPRRPGPGDFLCSPRPMHEWVDSAVREYEDHVRWSGHFDDDYVPYARTFTGTHLFASTFGCPVHIYGDSPAAARPVVDSAHDADQLTQPSLDAPVFERLFEFTDQLRRRLGPGVPIAVPDIQSPFDIAALVWEKEEFLLALYESPESVHRLVGKCLWLLTDFLNRFKARVAPANLCHCPWAWAPPELGCWLSEDEAGSISPASFEEFCLPSLVALSERFGGMFMHCCANADHQYANFARIPNLRGLNRVWQAPGPRPAFEAFDGRVVFMQAWSDEAFLHHMLDLSLPRTRLLMNVPHAPLEEARRVYDRLRKRAPRVIG